MFLEPNRKKAAGDAASLGDDFIEKAADFLGLDRFAHAAFLEFIREVGSHESDSGQLLADAVVKVMADAALFPVADFEDLAFEPFAFGDIASDALDLEQAPILF